MRGRMRWGLVCLVATLAIGCGRTAPLPGYVFEVDAGAAAAAGGSSSGGAGGAGGILAAAGSGGVANGGRSVGGYGGRAGAASQSGRAGADGTAGTGLTVVDRCRNEGPPPADGNPDGSDYHFGTPRTLLDIYPTYGYLELGDPNEDGYPDLLASSGGNLHLYEGTGPAAFAPYTPLPTGVSLYSYKPAPRFVDMDADGQPDIVVGHEEGMSVVWNDRGSFT